MTKRVAAIHDLSGLGKCSLTVALPIISAAGVECCCIPTALLSTHTGGFTGYTFKDLTGEMLPIARHWSSLPISFDAIYSGYLGTAEAAADVCEIINLLKSGITKVIIDPVMADNGKYYSGMNEKNRDSFLPLVKNADIVTPNVTEAAFLLGMEYLSPPYTKEYLQELAEKLCLLGAKNVVLTGAQLSENSTGAAVYDGAAFSICETELIPGYFHGGGDIFASVLTACVCRDYPLFEAADFAAKFVGDCIKKTIKDGAPLQYGMSFEAMLPKITGELNK